MLGQEVHVFYNLKLGRGDFVAARELRALHQEFEPATLSGCEANGYNLPNLGRLGTPTRDRSTEGRANLYAYGLMRRPRWVDQDGTWPRTDHPGEHGARALLVGIPATSRLTRLVVGHAPPNVPGAGHARVEWRRDAVEQITDGKRVLAVLDANGMGPEIARLAHARWDGNPTDCALGQGVRVSVELVERADSVPLQSDHPAVVVTVTKA